MKRIERKPSLLFSFSLNLRLTNIRRVFKHPKAINLGYSGPDSLSSETGTRRIE